MNPFRKKIFKAVYNPTSVYNEHGNVDENVIGYFNSVKEFKQAVLNRWPNTHRDVPYFYNETKDFIKVIFQTDGRGASGNIIVLREVKPVGFKYGAA